MKFTKAIKNFENGCLAKEYGTNKWIIVKEFNWYINYDDREGKITVPLGFVTDFGSIPQIFWGIYNPTKYVAYILHDFLYSSRYIGDLNRKKADKILREALKVEGMGKIKRNLVYLAVRLFGGVFYKNDNRK